MGDMYLRLVLNARSSEEEMIPAGHVLVVRIPPRTGRVNPGGKNGPGLTEAGAGTGNLDVLGSGVLANAAEWRRETERFNDRFIENLPRGV